MQQRYYDPIAGRFLSVDPVPASPESFNRYWYANNNPYRFTDPDGRMVCDGIGGRCQDMLRDLEKKGKFPLQNESNTKPSSSGCDADECKEYQQLNHGILRKQGEALEEAGIYAAKEGAMLYGGGLFGRMAGRIGRFFGLGGAKWTLGSGKSATKWANQMAKRGWNERQIGEALSTKGIPARNAVNLGNPATRHVHPETGQSVVIDNRTNEVIHVGGENFDYSDWDLPP